MHPSLRRGNSSVGRAQPCQGWGREFETRFPLQTSITGEAIAFPVLVLKDLHKGAIAKRLCSGLQSRLDQFDSGSRLQRFTYSVLEYAYCPGGEIGRHKGLKIPRPKPACRFDSGPGHQFFYIWKTMYCSKNSSHIASYFFDKYHYLL